jgi:hypothetical protein
MKLYKEYIVSLKERYENALSAAFSGAAEEASRKYGLPLSKLPIEMVRSLASANPEVKLRLEEWQKAASEDPDMDESQSPDDWSKIVIPGYEGEGGAPLSVEDALSDVSGRLESARSTLRQLVDTIHGTDSHARGFWLSTVLETATLVRVECGESVIVLSDIAMALRSKSRHERIRSKQEEARLLRDDAKALIDLAKAKQGIL